MKLRHIFNLAIKQVLRHRVRSLLTLAGVGAGMFLFTSVQTMQHSLNRVIQSGADDTVLVVYRENRFCPMTSRLPEHYLREIQRIPGVEEAIPIQIAVNNCGASLDVITFRGVPPATLSRYNPDLQVLSGSMERWQSRSDAALVGEQLARQRGLSPGDTFEAVGVRVWVAGIVSSPLQQDNNVAYVHLPFLQQSSRVGLGTVTQFNVRVRDALQSASVAQAIDDLFAADQAPTTTRPEKAFFMQTAHDMIEMIHFTRWIGLGAVMAVLGLVANSLLLAASGRVQESAVLQTIGYSRSAVSSIMVGEGAVLGLAGGLIGSLGATLFFYLQSYTIGNEGLVLALIPSLNVTTKALTIACALGLVASLWPAWTAAKHPLVESLRR